MKRIIFFCIDHRMAVLQDTQWFSGFAWGSQINVVSGAAELRAMRGAVSEYLEALAAAG